MWVIIGTMYYGLFPLLVLLNANIREITLQYIMSANLFDIVVGTIVGFIASLSITAFFLELSYLLFKLNYMEMENVQWIKEVKKVSPIFGSLAAMSEEYIFRLVLPYALLFLTNLNILFSMVLSSIIFTLLQMIYTKTKTQKIVNLISSFSISLVSIILVLIFHNILISIIFHAVYVFVFLKEGVKYDKG